MTSNDPSGFGWSLATGIDVGGTETRRAAEIARFRIGKPEREGVGER